ncbi:MAG: hypothetical protein ACLQIQ_14245 [Beijerinckiaceae bacterium]
MVHATRPQTATRNRCATTSIHVNGVGRTFNHEGHSKAAPRTVYKRLICDCVIDDDNLFQRADTIEPGWWVAQAALDACAKDGTKEMPVHSAQSSRQSKADSALTHYSQRWCTIKGARARGSS